MICSIEIFSAHGMICRRNSSFGACSEIASVTGSPEFRTAYFNEVRALLGTVFNADTTVSANPPFYQFVDAHLTGWAPPATIAAITGKFVITRRAPREHFIFASPELRISSR